ncbi:AFR305Wp [Eremothecium gossypii ATCC 10895]|uniref:AFR305Wp n=1 Tax=Eremothecium gossypii (strain ATCC 10895 / CBS 109.51 / FGSC 9923 / NRRL Y-1056) TaxID=284811 RepID=Q753K7_EREGS|nr:AFR305Wp [Eremothecium gossypii ATCC 10895]AAS53676.1 AFR305Wp [Eremothecium gossypii ATCC 10895]AEY97989.1 FAFR305Wp [Eremothecium gossypii FDAG1]
MCILFATTAHPKYKLVLISNRDEYFARKTHTTCWSHNDSILAPYDMALQDADGLDHGSPCGTWIGINRAGHVSVLLNLAPKDADGDHGYSHRHSRGAVTMEYLKDFDHNNWDSWNTYEKFGAHFPTLYKTKLFTHFYGDVVNSQFSVINSLGQTLDPFSQSPYYVVSNGPSDGAKALGQWPKVVEGNQLFKKMIQESLDVSEEELLQRCFNLASYSQYVSNQPIGVHDDSIPKRTIFVPALYNLSGQANLSFAAGMYYGTRSTIVMLVSEDGNVVTREHVIHDSDQDLDSYSILNPKEQVTHRFSLQMH